MARRWRSRLSDEQNTNAPARRGPEAFAARRFWLSKLNAPHVEMCGRLSTPGGHGADWADTATTKWVTTPQGARIGVDQIIPYKPDCLGEVMTDGWRYGTAPDDTSMNEDALTALVDEAHKNHIPVLTHTLRVEKGAQHVRGVTRCPAARVVRRVVDDDRPLAREPGRRLVEEARNLPFVESSTPPVSFGGRACANSPLRSRSRQDLPIRL